MEFRIADTFTDSLARLTGEEQKAVKTTAFDLQVNPASPGLSFHKLDRAKDKNFWSVRVSSDIRLIVHRTDNGILLCYVDHHDKAYRWAECRKLVAHPRTGAAQLVEIRETVQEIAIPRYIEALQPVVPKTALFENYTEEKLSAFGVPDEWLQEVKKANEDSLLLLADHLPREAAEALLELATGGQPKVPTPAAPGSDPFSHPDAARRFRILKNVDELERAFQFPWDKWAIFLHPEQQTLVEREFNGPARVSGSAGTGKTIVALHRAVNLARANSDARVLLTTFSEILASSLRTKLKRLVINEPRIGERLEVHSLDSIGYRLYSAHCGEPKVATGEVISKFLKESSESVAGHKFSLQFLRTEWDHVVEAWQLNTWESYRDIKRLGRKTRLTEQQRSLLWQVFEGVRHRLLAAQLITPSAIFGRLAEVASKSKNRLFDFVVVDEAQDVGIAHLRFLAALAGGRANGLFFAGDLGQRIFQQPFSWKALGVDVRGRSRTLNVNYRTSHQIRMHADRLLGPEVADADGNVESRGGTVSVFNGPVPIVRNLADFEEEIDTVSKWLIARSQEGLLPHEIGVFVRSDAQIDRARKSVENAGLPFRILDDKVEAVTGQTAICTMHLAKGLEFRAVAIMACDDEVIPLQERIETVTDDSDLQDVYDTERHLLYVACTRARDHLLVSSGDAPSEFLDDLKA